MNETLEHLNAVALPFLRFVEPEPLSSWADENRYIADGASPEPGRWRTSRTPYMRQIMDDVTAPNVRSIAICAGVQIAKTECLLSAIAYYMQHDPTTIMLVEPDEKLVTDIGVDRVDSMIRATPALRELFDVNDAGNTSKKRSRLLKHMKRFPGGYLFLASSASPSALKSRSIRVVLCDEIDVYPLRSDGHPVDMAIGRATTFIDSKVVLVSSPTTLETSEIFRRVQASETQFEYRIPCQHCGEYLLWSWDMVKWDNGQSKTARMVCPSCGGIIRGSGAASDSLLASGEWFCVKGDPDAQSHGYTISGLLSPWKPLSGMVAEFLSATHDRDVDRLRTFVQERLAQPWDSDRYKFRSESRESTGNRFEDAPDHSGVRIITAGVDCQKDRLEVTFVGWGRGCESWVLEHTIIPGDTLLDDVWMELARVLQSPPTLSTGRQLPVYAVAVDSGGYAESAEISVTQKVYQFCGQLVKRNVIPVKGGSREHAPAIAPPTRTAVRGVSVYVLNVGKLKEQFLSRLDIGTAGPGYVHIPAAFSGEYWEQLHAETLEVHVEHGQRTTRWVKNRERNEALDCYVYALAAYEIFSAKARQVTGRTHARKIH